MDPGRVLRQARQEAGLSQRAVALRAGVSARTVAGVEADQHRPSLAVLEALLGACGLELVTQAAVEVPAACTHLRAHLTLSLSQRISDTISDTISGTGRADEVVHGLRLAAEAGVAVLEPVAAAAAWVPGVAWPLPVVVTVFPAAHGWPRRRPQAPAPEVVVLRRVSAPSPSGLVRVRLPASVLDVHVHSPDVLARDVSCRESRRALAAAARLLDVERGRDAVGRRAPAHRQPDEDGEAWRLSQALRYISGDSPMRPRAVDSRAFRLDAPVSLPQWLDRNGLPPLRGQRERW